MDFDMINANNMSKFVISLNFETFWESRTLVRLPRVGRILDRYPRLGDFYGDEVRSLRI